MSESIETKLARVEEKLDTMIERLKNGDAIHREFEKRIAALEQKAMTGTILVVAAWGVFLAWFRMTGG